MQNHTHEKWSVYTYWNCRFFVNNLSTNNTTCKAGATVRDESIWSFLAMNTSQNGSKSKMNLGDQCKPLLYFGTSSSFKISLAFQGRAMWRRAGVKVKVITFKALVCFYQAEAFAVTVMWINRIMRQGFCLKCWSHLDMCLNSFYKVILGLSKINPYPVLGGKKSITFKHNTLCKSMALVWHEIFADFAKQVLCLFLYCLPFTWHTGRDASRGWQETCVT